ncbi:hypothetical protein HNY73_018605 [Argiope bruennichi]|uniref:Uncharacterized protein n=1 Tax=Argiope bruennichi TaxID=94029 RepID=A0A8T0EET8_ARGBR|nr:hypothetical protein HNY73_018605 [Argiope bruennichi]
MAVKVIAKAMHYTQVQRNHLLPSPEPSSHLEDIHRVERSRATCFSPNAAFIFQNSLKCCNTSFARPAPTPPNDQSAEDDSGQRELVVPPPPRWMLQPPVSLFLRKGFSMGFTTEANTPHVFEPTQVTASSSS